MERMGATEWYTIKALEEKKEKLNARINELEEENKNLKEEVRFLEECLDRKEKVNKSLREELSKYKKQYEHSMGGEINYIIYDDSSTEKSNIPSGIFTSGLATLNEKEIGI